MTSTKKADQHDDGIRTYKDADGVEHWAEVNSTHLANKATGRDNDEHWVAPTDTTPATSVTGQNNPA